MNRLIQITLIAALLLTAGCATLTPPPAEPEARAIWVTRWDYKTADDVRAIIANCADLNFNVILFQVRGNGTVFYPSAIEPWAWELTSDGPETTGQDPGWDPLALAVELAHARGMELHAYMNVFPAWRTQQYAPLEAGQLWSTHPEWFMCDAAGEIMRARDHLVDPERRDWYTFISPGIIAVQDYLASVFEEVVANYDIDGIHYDYVRYPAEIREVAEGFEERAAQLGNWSYDPVSLARFTRATGVATPDDDPEAWVQWRCDQITETVRKIDERVRALDPDIMISGSVMANPVDAHDTKFQSYVEWMERGTLDMAVTMNYTADPDEFRERCQILFDMEPSRGFIMPGLNFGHGEEPTLAEIEIAREFPGVGFAGFAYSYLFDRDNGHVRQDLADTLAAGPLAAPAPLPW